MIMTFRTIVIISCLSIVNAGETPVPIGGLFDADDWQQEIAFRYAVDRINMDRAILPKIKLVPQVEHVVPHDTFKVEKKACNMTSTGLGAFFGPQTAINSEIIKSICETLELPNLLTHWDINQDETLRCSINLHPEPHLLSKALADLIQEMGWTSFTMLYDDDESLIYLQEVLKIHTSSETTVLVHQLDPYGDHRPLLKEIQAYGETHLILHCKPEKVISFLHQAAEVKMLEEYQSYIISHLDTHTIDFGEFKYSRTNITSMRIVDPTNNDIINAVHDWTQGELRYGRVLEVTPETVKAEASFMYDAVFLYALALHSLESPRNRIHTMPLNCDSTDKWDRGYGLSSYMKLMQPQGLSGNMRFDQEGRRIYFELNVVELSRAGFVNIGNWDPENKIVYNRELEDLQNQKIAEKMENKTFIVSSRLGAPYLMMKESNETLEGNDRYEGYSMTLIEEIAKILNFKFKFELVPDGKYGSYNKVTKKWDGLVKQLLDRKADLAICDLTITHERKSAVDFTMPFMTLGISIIYSKPEKSPPELFSFLSPFSLDVWMYMATAYLGVSLLLFFLSRMSPFEWDNPHACVETCEELENNFNLLNCLWFSMGSLLQQGSDILPKISPYEWAKPHPCVNEADEMETNMNLSNSIWHNCGSLMQQGSDIAPKAISTRMVSSLWCIFTLIMKAYTANLTATLTNHKLDKFAIRSVEDLAKQNKIRAVSTRMVAGMWWFFTLIMISSYTANLAAFLTAEKMEEQIKSAEDLAKQNKIKYGAVVGGSTAGFFKNSNFSTYQKMWTTMESTQPSVFTKTNDEGIERVLKGKRGYAFLMESSSIEYQVERLCELEQIGLPLDSKGYGIAMPMNSPYRTAISGAVLKMQEDGRLQKIKDMWWKNEGSPCSEGESGGGGSEAELGLDNVGGVFVVLVLGCVAGFFMAIIEFLWNIRKIAVEEEITPKEALMNELKFALACDMTTKPVRKKKSSSKSSESSASSLQLNEFGPENIELAKQ